jgi:archaemetzincin
MRPWCLALMGAVEPAAADAVEEALAAHCRAAVARLVLPEPDFAYDAARLQYGSVPVLHSLSEARPRQAWKLLGLTGKDLFIPMLTFVYGQAQLNGATGVVSLARLRQEFYGLPADERILLTRARKEALHEAGHLLGLVHCNDKRCAMSLATNVRQLDGKGAEYCPACAALVERHHGPRERVNP